MLRLTKFLGLLAVIGVVGCEPTPVAPSLQNTAVYQDSAAGVRFIAPQNWILYARTTIPRGKVEKPIRLVGYNRVTTDGRADLELYVADYPKSVSLAEYLQQHPIGPEKWIERDPPTELTLPDGVPALKHLLVSAHQKLRQRDFWEIRRSEERVFIFICSAMTADRSTRDQARRAVETVTFDRD